MKGSRVYLLSEDLDKIANAVAEKLEAARDEFFDVDGAADFLKTTGNAVRKLAERGKIPKLHLESRLRFSRNQLTKYLLKQD